MQEGLSWQYIGGARSALSSTLPPVEGFKIGDHPSVSRLVKGALELRPPIPALVPQWSVAKVLRELDSWDMQKDLSLMDLTLKTILLVALASAKRVDSISKFVVTDGFLEVSDSMARIQPISLEKNSRADHLPPVVKIQAYPDRITICPLCYLKGYLRRTEPTRSSPSLFVTVNAPNGAASKVSLRRYIVAALEKCEAFSTPGSPRSASTWRARAMGAPMATILEAGDWAGAEVFKKHNYNALPLSFVESVWS